MVYEAAKAITHAVFRKMDDLLISLVQLHLSTNEKMYCSGGLLGTHLLFPCHVAS